MSDQEVWDDVWSRRQQVADDYSILYFGDGQIIPPNAWMGQPAWKSPLDMWIYQEIAFDVKPKLVIETGTHKGGSAVFWRDMMRLASGGGHVVSVDVQDWGVTLPLDPEFTWLRGDSTSWQIVEKIHELAYATDGPVLVNLDSLHDAEHVFREMELYHDIVTPGSYMIVEDGNINGHPTHIDFGPGPYEACQRFLPDHPEFEIDSRRERLWVTANPGGYLRRKS